jgi:ribosomal protein S15P/S13E
MSSSCLPSRLSVQAAHAVVSRTWMFYIKNVDVLQSRWYIKNVDVLPSRWYIKNVDVLPSRWYIKNVDVLVACVRAYVPA